MKKFVIKLFKREVLGGFSMSIFLTLAYLFFIGSVLGWVIELLFRNIVHHNKKWVNPGPTMGIEYRCG